MLQCNDLVKSYRKKNAVNHLSLNLEAGKIYALLGPNGSGKTTLMKMIAGLVKPTAGSILFEGKPVDTASKARIAYMPTEAFFYSYMTGRGVTRENTTGIFSKIFTWSGTPGTWRRWNWILLRKFPKCPPA